MTYSVTLLPEAEADFEEIYEYLFDRSPTGAANWSEAFSSGLERLRKQPETCGLAEEPVARKRGLRQLLFGTKYGRTYRTIFLIENDLVVVLRIRGPGQRPVAKRDLPS